MYDLLIRGGHVIDPSQGVDGVRDIAASGTRIAVVADRIPEAEAARVLNATGMIVTPGLVDLHVHVYEGVSHYGVHADTTCLAHGVTTVVDAGSAGAQTFPGFRKYVIEASRTRIYALLNISIQGMLSDRVTELLDLRWIDIPHALQVVERNRDVILGIKVRLSEWIAGENDLVALENAREAAEAARLPMMVHISKTAHSLDDILDRMRPGDVVTHCYHGHEEGILDPKGKVRNSVRKAIEKGIVFDVGHGAGSFDFQVVKRAKDQGVWPGTISSDLHTQNVHGPVFDLVTTLSKFLHLGMALPDVIERATSAPVRSLGLDDRIGTLAPGAWADVTVLELREGRFVLRDSMGRTEEGHQKLFPAAVVRAGAIYYNHSCQYEMQVS